MKTDIYKFLADAEQQMQQFRGIDARLRTEWLSCLEQWKKQLESPWRLAIVGMVKEGKSTFMNALLGHDLLATGSLETTGAACVITNKMAPRPERPVRCVYKDNREEQWLSVEDAKLIHGKDDAHLEYSEQIEFLEYCMGHCAIPILDDCELVDTPGTGACVGEDHKTHDRVTFSHLSNVDAIALLVQDTLRAGNSEILDRFSDACRSIEQGRNITGHILFSKSDVGAYSVDKMEETQIAKCSAIRKEAIENFHFDDSIRVRAVSPLLAKAAKYLGLSKISRLYYILYPEAEASVGKVPEASMKKARKVFRESLASHDAARGTEMATLEDLIMDILLHSPDPDAAMERMYKLSGIGDFCHSLQREMKERVPLCRSRILLLEMQKWMENNRKLLVGNSESADAAASATGGVWNNLMTRLRFLLHAVTEKMAALEYKALRQYDAGVQVQLTRLFEKEKNRVDELREECEVVRLRSADLEKEISSLTAEIAGLQQRVVGLSAEVTRLKTEKENLQEELPKSQALVHELQENIEQLKKEIARLNSENEGLRNSIDELRQTAVGQERQIADLLRISADLQRENDALKTRVMGLDSANADLERVRNELRGQVVKLTTELRSERHVVWLWKAAVAFALGGGIGWWFAFSHQDKPTAPIVSPIPSQEICIVKDLCDLTKKQQTELVKYVESLQQKAQKPESVPVAVDKNPDESDVKLKAAEDRLSEEKKKVEQQERQISALTNENHQLQTAFNEFSAKHQNCEVVAKELATYESILAELKEITKAKEDDYSDLIGIVNDWAKTTSAKAKLSPTERKKLESALEEHKITLSLLQEWEKLKNQWYTASNRDDKNKLWERVEAKRKEIMRRLKMDEQDIFKGDEVEAWLKNEKKKLKKRLGIE